MSLSVRYQLKRLKIKVRHNGALAVRLFELIFYALKYLFIIFVADAVRRRFGKTPPPTRPGRLREFFESIGGSFLKLGQMMALQPDLIPIEYCDELFDLLDRIPPFEFETAERIFREETKRELADVFDDVSREPLATASIGQVYVATLEGHKVALKVQRPKAESLVTSDVRVASFAVRIIRTFSFRPFYWLLEPMSEFIRWSREELDFRYEARYTQKVRDNARGELYEKVPEVFWDFTTRRILVIEFLDGITVIDFLRKREEADPDIEDLLPPGYSSSAFCTHIVENFLGGAFNCGLFHADLHPGNLMILPDSVVGYIDFGITGILSDYSRSNLISLTLAYAQGNIEQMLKAFTRVSILTEDSDLEKLDRGLRRRSKHWYGDGDGDEASITGMMLDWLKLSKESDIWPQRDVIKYIRCSVVMDGLIKRLDPDFDVGAALAKAAHAHLEAGLRRNVFSYERVFEALYNSGELMSAGPTALRTAVSNVAKAFELPPRN